MEPSPATSSSRSCTRLTWLRRISSCKQSVSHKESESGTFRWDDLISQSSFQIALTSPAHYEVAAIDWGDGPFDVRFFSPLQNFFLQFRLAKVFLTPLSNTKNLFRNWKKFFESFLLAQTFLWWRLLSMEAFQISELFQPTYEIKYEVFHDCSSVYIRDNLRFEIQVGNFKVVDG